MSKKSRWKILDSGKSSAEENMELDNKLLNHVEELEEPLLHLYEWNGNAGTYGYFTKPENLLNLTVLSDLKIELAKRPTGGGIIFHMTDFAFSMLIPASHPAYSANTLENYAYVNNLILQTLQNLTFVDAAESHLLLSEPLPKNAEARFFCMAKPTIYDIVYEGKKIGGGAQRRTKKGILHQGSLSIAHLEEEFLREILIHPHVIEAMRENTGLLVNHKLSAKDIEEVRQTLRKGLVKTLLEI